MVYVQSLERVLIRTATPLFVLVALGVAHPVPAGAQNDPVWQSLVDAYANEYPGVIVDHDVTMEVLLDTNYRVSTRIKHRIQIALFDVKRAEAYLNQVIPLPYGYKVKHKKAWSMEVGGQPSGVSAKDSDFHERTLFGKQKELRISIPGLRKQGYATVEVEMQGRGFPSMSLQYADDLPLQKGTFTLRAPGTAGAGASGIQGMILSQIVILNRGYMKLVSDQRGGRREISLGYECRNVPALYTDPGVPKTKQPRATIDLFGRYGTWKDMADGLSEWLDDADVPGKLIKSVRDTLKDASPREAVEALARFLDDPARLRLVGDPRGSFYAGDLQEAIDSRKGTPFEKALLAYRLLRALKIDASVVLTASRYHTNLDWRSRVFSQLDAVLIWVPAISEDFLWDVASRHVPLGMAGSDLYTSMLVLDPDEFDATRDFPVGSGRRRESRSLDLQLQDGGSLAGTLTCRFESFPLEPGLDPWDRTVDLKGSLETMAPPGVEVSDVEWKEPGSRSMRCTSETPAVLEAHLTHEAVPAGETGWDIAPFLLPLPRSLERLEDPDRESPLLLTNSFDITDAVRMDIGDHRVVTLPDAQTVRTPAGDFSSSWEQGPNGVVAIRRLTVEGSVIRLQDQSSVARLCKAWRESQTQTIRVD